MFVELDASVKNLCNIIFSGVWGEAMEGRVHRVFIICAGYQSVYSHRAD